MCKEEWKPLIADWRYGQRVVYLEQAINNADALGISEMEKRILYNIHEAARYKRMHELNPESNSYLGWAKDHAEVALLIGDVLHRKEIK